MFVAFSVDYRALRAVYMSHCNDHYFVSRKQRMILSMVHEAVKFMSRHNRRYIFVEGDKGKLLGFLSRVEFAALCDAFIGDAVRVGEFSLNFVFCFIFYFVFCFIFYFFPPLILYPY